MLTEILRCHAATVLTTFATDPLLTRLGLFDDVSRNIDDGVMMSFVMVPDSVTVSVDPAALPVLLLVAMPCVLPNLPTPSCLDALLLTVLDT